MLLSAMAAAVNRRAKLRKPASRPAGCRSWKLFSIDSSTVFANALGRRTSQQLAHDCWGGMPGLTKLAETNFNQRVQGSSPCAPTITWH